MIRKLTNRRKFLKTAGAAAAGVALGTVAQAATERKPPQTVIPRWRGFNLLDFFQAYGRGERSAGMVSEADLKWIRDWGFDFIRMPMDYWLWIDTNWRKTKTLSPDDMYKIHEKTMQKVDRTVELGIKYGLHVNLNFHRAPGYCIYKPEREPFTLWSDRQAEDAFVFHWDLFAKRCRGVSVKDLSFNLVNEAPHVRERYMSAEDYRRVMTRATEAIRK